MFMVIGIDRALPNWDIKFKGIPFGMKNLTGNKGAIGCQVFLFLIFLKRAA